jgi:hypothetical protein
MAAEMVVEEAHVGRISRGRGRRGGRKAYAAKECIHHCNSVRKERDDLIFFFCCSLPCKSQTDTRHVTKDSP